jgi:hypothetical protein
MKELKVTQERLSKLVNLMGLIEGYLTLSEGEVTDSNVRDLYFMKRSVETLFISNIEGPYEDYLQTIPKDKLKDYVNTNAKVSNYFNFKENEEFVPFKVEPKQYSLFTDDDNLLADDNDMMLIDRFKNYLKIFEKRKDIQVFSEEEIMDINKETMKQHHSFSTLLSPGVRSINLDNCNRDILYILSLGAGISDSTREWDTFTFINNLNRKRNILSQERKQIMESSDIFQQLTAMGTGIISNDLMSTFIIDTLNKNGFPIEDESDFKAAFLTLMHTIYGFSDSY